MTVDFESVFEAAYRRQMERDKKREAEEVLLKAADIYAEAHGLTEGRRHYRRRQPGDLPGPGVGCQTRLLKAIRKAQ